jgi:hypothetical protein
MPTAQVFLDKKKVAQKMLDDKITLSDIKKRLKVKSEQAVRYHLSGSHRITMRMLYKFADIFNCNPSEISKVVVPGEEEDGI